MPSQHGQDDAVKRNQAPLGTVATLDSWTMFPWESLPLCLQYKMVVFILAAEPHEDLGEASAMKILYLLFPFFLLLIQGAAETGNEAQCRQRGGFCTIGRCHYPTTAIGRCSSYRHCCRSI
nr:uncharacterized protein LOC110355456 isoform X2 [Columba livia]